jgi:hypothetical protein
VFTGLFPVNTGPLKTHTMLPFVASFVNGSFKLLPFPVQSDDQMMRVLIINDDCFNGHTGHYLRGSGTQRVGSAGGNRNAKLVPEGAGAGGDTPWHAKFSRLC